jgi:catalase
VAFCTQNIVPGIDFTDDPLLQGRNFSYLDTQLKRLGSPNFSYLPVNAPKCPMAHFQQDGHMAMATPASRANYEPNSWDGAEACPREDPERGFTSFAEHVAGPKRRLRAESFADHYSQARQFYISQAGIEQRHIAEAFTFELSKCASTQIRLRMVAGLRNVDAGLAAAVAEGLGLRELPEAAPAAREPRRDLPESPALSIIARGPGSFAGRKIGVLVTNGADAETLAALRSAAESEGATVEIIAPVVAGVEVTDGTRVQADQQVDGAPSVLYDAVVVLAAHGAARALATRATARDFVTDAVAHCKFIGYTSGAAVLFEAAGLPIDPGDLDDGFVSLADNPAAEFMARCRQLRFWDRKRTVIP